MDAGFDYIGVGTPFFCHDGRGNWLLHKRSSNCRDEIGVWDPGSGQIEFGQDIKISLLREIKEEYGCSGEIQKQLPTINLIRNHQGRLTHWLQVPFIVKVNPREVKIGEPTKMLEIGWFKLDKLPKPLHSGFVYILANYREYFTKYL
ncbi:MAG: NUDIX domain-containing protein [Patescibacteria group bacterium]